MTQLDSAHDVSANADRKVTVDVDIPGFPYHRYPAGWFQIGWSDEFEVGKVTPATYFGAELVIYRGESGELRVTDAFCPHMGAHLGHGGSVEGDCLRCPFHSWLWNEHGRVVEIPYSDHLNTSRSLRHWTVRERNGVVFMWHHPEGEAPSWEDPIPTVEGAETSAFYPVFPHASHVEELRMQPQFGVENAADAGHLLGVHRWTGRPTLSSFSADGPVFQTVTDGVVPTSKGGLAQSIVINCYGVGIIFTTHVFNFDDGHSPEHETAIVCVTPTTGENSKLFTTSWLRRTPGDDGDVPTGRAAALVRGTKREMFEADAPIWRHMRYEPNPPYAREEAKVFHALRRWSSQFYPAG